MDIILFSLASVFAIFLLSGTATFLRTKHGSRSDLISPIPGDNSLYVEGVSRYIWMPDGENIPHLVDLQEPGPIHGDSTLQDIGDYNQYWLYTRANKEVPQVIPKGDLKFLLSSNFDSGKPLHVIVHGWLSDGHSKLNPLITSAILDEEDANVFVLDWRKGADGFYSFSVQSVPPVGEALGDFLLWIVGATGASWDQVHLIGFSLGGHVVGNAGRKTKSLLKRITGLDPAGPAWNDNENALKKTDAQYVEVIHTNGGTLGIYKNIGQADFYPNGGEFQPNCVMTCSHTRATELFAASVYKDHFNASRCTGFEAIQEMSCDGSLLKMGNINLTKRGEGLYGLRTTGDWPY